MKYAITWNVINITLCFKNPDTEGHIYMKHLKYMKPENRLEVARD